MRAGARPVCGLVNNIPDAAFEQTERQWKRLLGRAFGDGAFELRRFTLDGTERSPEVASRIQAHYSPVADLESGGPLDLVVMTGCEPSGGPLESEPSWPGMVGAIEAALAVSGSVVLSCLAAHAGLRHFDGLERNLLAEKCSGVLEQPVLVSSPICRRMPDRLRVPHSHHNSVPADEVEVAGWEVLIGAGEDWTAAWATRRGVPVLLLQGHPEYDADTLLREYRRDLARWRNGTSASPPSVPGGYLSDDAATLLEGHLRDGGPFPFDELAADLEAPWVRPSGFLMRNLVAEGAARRQPTPA